MKNRTALYSGIVALALSSNIALAADGLVSGEGQVNFPEPFVEDRGVSDVALIYPVEGGDIVVRGEVRGKPGFVMDGLVTELGSRFTYKDIPSENTHSVSPISASSVTHAFSIINNNLFIDQC